MARKTTITGEGIRDETVDSADIASGSIKAGELSAQSVSGQATITSTDTTNDRLLIWDATDSALKQVSIGNLGVTASPAGSDTQVQYNNGGVAAGATKLLYDDSNHRLGIGSTSAPSNILTAYGDASNEYVALIDNDAGTAGHGLKVTSDGTGTGTYVFDVEAASTTVFRVRGDGRVGIGKATSLPAAVLTVSSSNTDGDLAIAHKIQHIGDSDTFIEFRDDELHLAAGGRTFLKLEESGTDKLIVNHGALDVDFQVKGSSDANLFRTDAGNDKVGISTNTPAKKLEIIDADAAQLRLTHTANSNYVDIQATVAGDLEISPSNANGHVKFISANDAAIIVQSNDTGDSNAEVGFSVDGGSSVAFSLGVDDSDSDKFKIGSTDIETTTKLTIESGGNVGIGTETPGSTLDVNGSVSFPTGTLRTGAYTITEDDFCIVADCNASAFTLTLPSATDAMAGRIYTIKRMDSGNSGGGNMLTISRNGKNIDNVAGDLSLANLDAIMLQCIGALGGWIRIGSFIVPL